MSIFFEPWRYKPYNLIIFNNFFRNMLYVFDPLIYINSYMVNKSIRMELNKLLKTEAKY